MLNDIAPLADALRESREYTLAMYGHLEGPQWQVPLLDIVNPPLWELAHIAFFQEFFVRRWSPDDPAGIRSPSRLGGADAMFDSRVIPHDARWALQYPPLAEIRAYLDRTLADTLDELAASDPQDRHRFRLALFHEDMHGEALLMTLHTLGLPAPHRAHATAPSFTGGDSSDIPFVGGTYLQGAPRDAQVHAFDNEKWAHEVQVAPFSMGSRPVSNAAFAAFVEDGGYEREAWWSPEGWQWREGTGAAAPRNWRREGGSWSERWFDRWRALDTDAPVVQVNCHEAQAWCRWAGRRLPTEAEWEFAATNGGRHRYPWGDRCPSGSLALDYRLVAPAPGEACAPSVSGIESMIGGVWEWTSTPFAPYPGFETDAYAEYSVPWFHTHYALRGGCFATRSRMVHGRWRNFYLPHRNDVFAGFRTCALQA